MSIYNAMRSGVSALNANASAMSVIADNVANVNTIGYKRATTDFASMVNNYSTGLYSPGGVLSSTRRLIDVQGTIQPTASNTDLAISGEGFFIVSENENRIGEGGTVAFTRAGAFNVDNLGFMRNAQGFYLQGWPVASDGSVQSSPTSLSTLEPMNVANVVTTGEATTAVTIRANLEATEDIVTFTPPAAYSIGSMAARTQTPSFETSIEVFDSLGASRTVTLGFLKTGANQWNMEVYVRDTSLVDPVAAPNGLLASALVTFDASGQLSAAGITNTIDPATGLPQTVTGNASGAFTLPWATSTGADPTGQLTLNLAGTLSQFAAPYAVTSVVADGVPPGDLAELRVGEGGFLTATFSNGRARTLYQIPVATFLNPAGLAPASGGVFLTTLESGVLNMNPAGAGGAGEINATALESSNVDLASEFTDMIVTQRAYSASSKVITTADQMLEELISIKR